MKKLQFTEAQIVAVLGQAASSEMSVGEVCRLNNISENTFYRWRKRYGEMGVSEVRRLRALGCHCRCETDPLLTV